MVVKFSPCTPEYRAWCSMKDRCLNPKTVKRITVTTSLVTAGGLLGNNRGKTGGIRRYAGTAISVQVSRGVTLVKQ
jgi:hypothetical protein